MNDGFMDRFVVGDDSTGVASWKRTAYRTDDGEFWVAAYRFGDETAVTLAASYDGAPLLMQAGHAYVPLGWARRAYLDSPFIAIFDRRLASL